MGFLLPLSVLAANPISSATHYLKGNRLFSIVPIIVPFLTNIKYLYWIYHYVQKAW